jgi:sterol 24-C-methyltransferase
VSTTISNHYLVTITPIMASNLAPKAPPPAQKEDYDAIVSTFTSRFGPDSADPSQSKVTETERKKRQATAAQGADQYCPPPHPHNPTTTFLTTPLLRYYDFATSAYISGWGERFHYTPFGPSQSLSQALDFYEHKFASLIGLRPGMTVLDVGCGVGGPAREIARFTGCHVVGITINARQVARAVELTAEAGLSDRCTFIQGDYLALPFPEASFDAAYAIEATVHAPDLAACYAGIAKVLKPGAIFGLSEWVLTTGYDPSNPEHIAMRNRVERGNAVSNLQTSDHARQAMLTAGYTLLHEEDYAMHFRYLSKRRSGTVRIPGDIQGALLPMNHKLIPPPRYRPWWYPLEGNTKLVHTREDWWITWRMSPSARQLCYIFVWVLEHLRLYPKGTLSAMATMAYCVDSGVEGGKADIFSPCWWFIGRKGMEGTGSVQEVIGDAAAAAKAVINGESSTGAHI